MTETSTPLENVDQMVAGTVRADRSFKAEMAALRRVVKALDSMTPLGRLAALRWLNSVYAAKDVPR